MRPDEFKRILTAFADSPADLDMDKGQLLVKIRDEVIIATLKIHQGEVFVVEDGSQMTAHMWIVQRLARLDSLADRLQSFVPTEKYFVEPSGRLLDQLEVSPEESESHLEGVSAEILGLLERQPAFTTSILYLTSDAGEGKTTVINHLARAQAEKYKKKETTWLLVPVSLGGRPFLRFDDVVVGTLSNRYRFPFLFYDAFLELTRMGVIVPALDGFEEMFIENASGDAISSLGLLLSELNGNGSILIAARKAYFEYRRLQTQTKLFDALRKTSVSFSRVAINRWDQNHFVRYCTLRGISNGRAIHEELSRVMGNEQHPALTRAVFVRKVVDVVTAGNVQENFIAHLKVDSRHYVTSLVESILEREATEKWIDKSGEVAKPLITVGQHRRLLADFATELLNVKAEIVPGDVLDVVGELFCDTQRLDTVVARQVVDRFKQHALIVEVAGSGGRFSFDHAEFYHYFIGEALGRALCDDSITDARYIMRQAILPQLSIERAVEMVSESGLSKDQRVLNTVDMLVDAAEGEGTISYARENCGALAIVLLDGCNNTRRILIKGITFASDALLGKSLCNITFEGCFFRRTSLLHTRLQGVSFVNCQIESIELARDTLVAACEMHGVTCASVVKSDGEEEVFNPTTVLSILGNAGFTVAEEVAATGQKGADAQDEKLHLTEKLLRAFMRTTVVSEFVLKQKFGNKATIFFDTVMPSLLRAGILLEEPQGAGKPQGHYRLVTRFQDVWQGFQRSNGSFERFVSILSERHD